MKKWNILNLIMNDSTHDYKIQVTDENSEVVTLISSENFKKILKHKYGSFCLLTPYYYDTVEDTLIELVNTRPEAIDWLYDVFSTWKSDREQGFLKLYQALRAEYDPITNYDKTIKSTMDYKGTETNTNTPTGKEVNTNIPTGSETITSTPTGTETVTTTPSGSETNTHAIAGTETNTNTKSGTEMDTLIKSGSEINGHSIGERVRTVAETAYNDDTFKNANKTTDSSASDTDTLQFTNRSDTNTKSFTNRQDTDVKSYTNRQDTDTKSFTNRKDTEVKTFTERQDTEVHTFTNRQTVDEKSFINRQTTDVKSFTNREDEYNYHEYGNIGVTTSQQMIESQFPLTDKDKLMQYIVNLFVHENLIL